MIYRRPLDNSVAMDLSPITIISAWILEKKKNGHIK